MTIPEVSMLASGWALGIQTMLIVQAVQMRLDDRRDRRHLEGAQQRLDGLAEATAALERAHAAKAAAEAMQESVDRFRATLRDGGHLPKGEA